MTEASGNYGNGHEDKLDLLIDQVGRLTEGLTEIKNLIAEQNEISRRQAATAETQARSVDRLIGLIEGDRQ